MKTVIDPGHKYELLTLDSGGTLFQFLTFVKRYDPSDPTRFPGNYNAYPGTTLQSVIRCLIERISYLQNQIWAPENVFIRFFLMSCLWLLEFRAARRHGRSYFKSLKFASEAPMCNKCGHTVCEHEKQNNL